MDTQGYIPKKLSFDDEARQKLIKGITEISKAVKSTLGPLGKTVLIESPNHTSGITITKDGVTVAQSVFLDDPIENLAIQMMKDAANRTANTAGDGTTTAIVLTEAFVNAGNKHIKKHNTSMVVNHINALVQGIVCDLEKHSKKISENSLLDVACISANNDEEIGKIIADAYNKVGINGIVTVENSMTANTYAEVTNGIKIARGYTSNLFVNNQKKDECILEDVKILVCDAEINNVLQIENVLKTVINNGDKLLIIAPCSGNVINTLAANVARNGLKFCNIQPPSFGYKTNELMQDIAVSVGAKYFSEKTGDDLSLITYEDLGHADKCIIGKESSILIKSNNDGVDVSERVSQLWNAHEIATNKADKEFILSRIASFSGGVGVIYVGGHTDLEQKELFDRVDDAVCAVRSALLEGILPGGGVALYKEGLKVSTDDGIPSESKKIAYAILSESLKSPLNQILSNAGSDWSPKFDDDDGHGINVKTGDTGDMIKMGIIDPMKVTKSALQNAVSVAVTILSTNAIVTMARTFEASE